MHPHEIRPRLLSRAELMRDGMTEREIMRSVGARELQRLGAGVYMRTAEWETLYADGRQLAHVIAAQRRLRGGGAVFSHISAAAVHGLPVTRCEPDRVHVRGGSSIDGWRDRGRMAVARHRMPVPGHEIADVDGIPCTSLVLTVADVLRTERRETGMAVACAALRRVAIDPQQHHDYDEDAAEDLRRRIAAHLRPGARGVRRAREVLPLADGRAANPGEALSLLYLHDLGYRHVRLQLPVAGPAGSTYYLDFDLGRTDVWGEFDGKGKYTDESLRGGKTPAEVVLAEKEREDWVRGTTRRRPVRWGWDHIASVAHLQERLTAFRVFPR
ncbi:hypothetical protein [Microbacterium sp. No. 7]|uniref:hypothetical protein n=1 Tax=Microbacterium sp. No. 7 TaxID=1714373 RepID=UPI0012E245AB|nr:hypothetical protein [Microbacterium sp. No. 7]